MNGLVGIRSNSTGFLSPTTATRAEVAKQLAEAAAARAGKPMLADTGVSTLNARAASSTGPTSNTDDSTANGASGAGETNGTNNNSSPGAVAQKSLDKDAFLQLLVLQMQSQDPLNPMDNSDMVAQLAQFSALEAQTNLNKSFEVLSGNVDQLNFISGAQLLGKTVTGVGVDDELRTGVVQSVHLDGSLVMLNVDGKLMSMANVYSVATEAETTGEGAAS